jgi:hypothetical protein
VSEAGIEAQFLINQAMVLSREFRLHTELSEGEFREKRLALLHPQWGCLSGTPTRPVTRCVSRWCTGTCMRLLAAGSAPSIGRSLRGFATLATRST